MTLTYWPTSGDSAHGGSSGEDKWELMEPTWLNTGVIQGIGNEFAVYADSTGMRVKIPSGRAWIDGTMVNEDAAAGDIIQTIAAADPTNPRIDRVVIRRDFVAHTMVYAVITGTPATAPVPPSVNRNPAGVFDLSLAQVRINAAVVTIAPANVTDERNNPAVGGWATQGNTALVCTSATHPSSWPRGGQIFETDTATLRVNVGTFLVPSWTTLQLGTVSPESFYLGNTVTISADFAVTGNIMYVFCMQGVNVTLPDPRTTNRPITVMAVSGNSAVIAAAGSVSGGSIDANTGSVLNGTINQGDALTFKGHSTDGGTTWLWRAVY